MRMSGLPWEEFPCGMGVCCFLSEPSVLCEPWLSPVVYVHKNENQQRQIKQKNTRSANETTGLYFHVRNTQNHQIDL